MITPVFKELKREGYHVTANISKDAMKVLMHNPYIDEFMVEDISKLKIKDRSLDDYWGKISKGFDRVINLSGTIEEDLLRPESRDTFFDTKEKRHADCNKNYYDYTLEKAGYPDIKGRNGELHFTKNEHKQAQKKMMKYKDKFVVLWSLSGSSYHKVYPYAEYVACEFLERYPNTVVITVGDIACQLLEWEHPRTICKSDRWSIRESMIMTKYVDLVVGTETGILNAVGCYDTDKVILLSHSSHENLSKYWENCYPVQADVPCIECHQLHEELKSCPLGDLGVPICMENLMPNVVLNTVEKVYFKWQQGTKIENKLNIGGQICQQTI